MGCVRPFRSHFPVEKDANVTRLNHMILKKTTTTKTTTTKKNHNGGNKREVKEWKEKERKMMQLSDNYVRNRLNVCLALFLSFFPSFLLSLCEYLSLLQLKAGSMVKWRYGTHCLNTDEVEGGRAGGEGGGGERRPRRSRRRRWRRHAVWNAYDSPLTAFNLLPIICLATNAAILCVWVWFGLVVGALSYQLVATRVGWTLYRGGQGLATQPEDKQTNRQTRMRKKQAQTITGETKTVETIIQILVRVFQETSTAAIR